MGIYDSVLGGDNAPLLLTKCESRSFDSLRFAAVAQDDSICE